MSISDFKKGSRYLLRDGFSFSRALFEVRVVEVAETAVKFRYNSGAEIWRSEAEVAGYTCQEVLP